MFLSLAKAGKFPVLIYESKMVSNSAWVSLGTLSDAGNFGACSSKCDSVSKCGAFAFDQASAYCELGEGLNLPADEVSSGGKAVFACENSIMLSYPRNIYLWNKAGRFTEFFLLDRPPSDCRSTSAISQGYQAFDIVGSYLLASPTKGTKEAAQAACEAAGGRLATFKKQEEWEDVVRLLNGK